MKKEENEEHFALHYNIITIFSRLFFTEKTHKKILEVTISPKIF